MNLLRSICCFFDSRCAPEEVKSTEHTMRDEPPVPADLGQTEAELEKTGKEQMAHMERDDASKRVEQEPTRRSTGKPRP